jgi:rod shape-determining protein MreC
VILETTRIRGILRGDPNGLLEIVDILADKRIQKGEVVLTAGGDQVFPRGLPVGVVDQVVPDPLRDSFIDVMVTPAAHLDRLDEVLVITNTAPRFSDKQQQDIATSEALKGSEAAAIKEQKKAADIMAERLPGLIDPKLPPDQQPLHDSSNPTPVAHPPQALHPDRFTPGPDGVAPSGSTPQSTFDANDGSPHSAPASKKPSAPAASPARPPAQPAAKPARPRQPQQDQPPTNQPQANQPGGNR